MASRLIREGILESEAINSVTVEAKWLYMVICLSADDLGLFEATEFKLSRKSDLKKENVLNCLNQLADAGLIRLYSIENKSYGFIPKFGQRLQIKRAKHPLPNPNIYSDDEVAKNGFNKILGLEVIPLLDNGITPYSTVAKPSEVEVEVEVEKVKDLKTNVVITTSPPSKPEDGFPDCPHQKIISIYKQSLPELPHPRDWSGARASALKARWVWVLQQKTDKSERTEEFGIDYFKRLFDYIAQSDFLTGRATEFKASLDWICANKNFLKIIEGKYENRKVAA